MKPSPRILELAQRLVAAGPKCCAVSASETHEITDFILSLDDDKLVIAASIPEGGESGFSVEHILLSVIVVHTNRIIQYDDSCARLLEIHLKEYAGVVRVDAKAQYEHSKTEIHIKGCECHHCQPPKCDGPTSPGGKPPLGLKHDTVKCDTGAF